MRVEGRGSRVEGRGGLERIPHEHEVAYDKNERREKTGKRKRGQLRERESSIWATDLISIEERGECVAVFCRWH